MRFGTFSPSTLSRDWVVIAGKRLVLGLQISRKNMPEQTQLSGPNS